MTFGEGKNKVYKLLDEYSSGGEVEVDEDIEKKMADLFDIAQKRIARIERITAVKTINRKDGQTEYKMPETFSGLRRVWRDGKPTKRYRWKNGKLVIPTNDTATTIEVEFYKTPETITDETGEDYEFEVSEDAAQLMPFYVAAQNLFADLMIDYTPYLNEWEKGLAELERLAQSQDQIGFTNTFYRSE